MLVVAGAAGLAVSSVRSAGSDFAAGAALVHVDQRASARILVEHRAAGVEANDNTILISPGGDTPPTHASGWRAIDVTPFGVPQSAKAVLLSFKALITKGTSDGTAVVFAFARAPGADCCHGPAGFAAYPIDWNQKGGMVAQAVVQLASDSNRTWTQGVVPLQNGTFEFAWGYRKVDGEWPAGDAVGTEVYVSGWLE